MHKFVNVVLAAMVLFVFGWSFTTEPTALVEMAPRPVPVYVILGITGVKMPRVVPSPLIDPPNCVVVVAEPMFTVLLLVD